MAALKRDIDTTPDAAPVTEEELVEAIEWLHRAGIVSGERPSFVGFFDEAKGKPAPSQAANDLTDELADDDTGKHYRAVSTG